MKNHAVTVVEGVISDGVLVGELPSLNYERHYVTLEFFTDANASTVVEKSTMTGVATIMFSENGTEYGSVTNGDITLGSAMYNRPHVAGSYRTVKVDTSGITSAGLATFIRMTVYSHE